MKISFFLVTGIVLMASIWFTVLAAHHPRHHPGHPPMPERFTAQQALHRMETLQHNLDPAMPPLQMIVNKVNSHQHHGCLMRLWHIAGYDAQERSQFTACFDTHTGDLRYYSHDAMESSFLSRNSTASLAIPTARAAIRISRNFLRASGLLHPGDCWKRVEDPQLKWAGIWEVHWQTENRAACFLVDARSGGLRNVYVSNEVGSRVPLARSSR